MLRTHKALIWVGLASLAYFWQSEPALAQMPKYPGYLGVYVMEGHGGMFIQSFIRGTPAHTLATKGDISARDTIVRLGGRSTRTLGELLSARNRIPPGKEAKMVLRDEDGSLYHVWISRNRSAAATSTTGAADTFRSGAAGWGGDQDFRELDADLAPDDEEIRDRR
jgi:hypothetical protein